MPRPTATRARKVDRTLGRPAPRPAADLVVAAATPFPVEPEALPEAVPVTPPEPELPVTPEPEPPVTPEAEPPEAPVIIAPVADPTVAGKYVVAPVVMAVAVLLDDVSMYASASGR